MEETEIGHRSVNRHIGVPVIWVEDIRLLPHSKLSACTFLLRNRMPFKLSHRVMYR